MEQKKCSLWPIVYRNGTVLYCTTREGSCRRCATQMAAAVAARDEPRQADELGPPLPTFRLPMAAPQVRQVPVWRPGGWARRLNKDGPSYED